MTIATALSSELETLLRLIAEELQLPPSLDQKARERYKALTEYLQETELGRYPISVYAQGSYRIGTTVKPLQGEEFDLDFVLELLLPSVVSPDVLMDMVWDQVQRNGHYSGMLERRPSCIRLLYADEFHMDIVPAVPDEEHGGTSILIPRETAGALAWHGTNPRGYAAWFESLSAMRVLTKEMAVEPLPPPADATEKTPLQTAVQLYKRNHHIAVTHEHLRTPSIVLTTIAGETATGTSTLGEAINSLVDSLAAFLTLVDPPDIANPAAPYEVVSDKWADPRVFKGFQSHAARLRRDWNELVDLQGTGFDALVQKLNEMFGEWPVTRAVKAASERLQAARAAGALSTGAGGALQIGPATRPNRPHTYFGSGSA
jgi:hypothetical protein